MPMASANRFHFLHKSDSSRHASIGAPQAEEVPVGKVVMHATMSVDGFVADEDDQSGPLSRRHRIMGRGACSAS
jgi:hypothetical protein